MNAKIILVAFLITMLVTDQAEAGLWGWIKKGWNSKIGKTLRNKAAKAATNLVAEKIGVTPEQASEMPFDEVMDALYEI
uniref:Putative Non Disulfide Bridge Peptide n=1 Tax=Megacormus gertschi TaxID=1843536 RepID=A0A224XGP4_9SCOR